MHAMNTNPVAAKVRSSDSQSTTLLIRTHGLAIEAEFADLVPCEFPIWTSASVPVEIPAGGTKSYIVGPFSGSVTQKTATGEFPNIIKFPVYRAQRAVALTAYEELGEPVSSQVLAKVPVAALATAISGVVRGRLVQTHSVLPLWHDGSSVLVRLDWYEGEPAEGTPNPEWHMSASTGLPARLGFERLREASRLPAEAEHCRYQVHVSPWALGASLLEDKGQEVPHPIWQREWSYDRFEEFEKALGGITHGLAGSGASRGESAA